MYFAKIIVKWNFLSDCEKQKLLKRWKNSTKLEKLEKMDKKERSAQIGHDGQK